MPVPTLLQIIVSYGPVIAGVLVSLYVLRSGVTRQLDEHRRKTLELVTLRSAALEQALREAQESLRNKDAALQSLELALAHEHQDALRWQAIAADNQVKLAALVSHQKRTNGNGAPAPARVTP